MKSLNNIYFAKKSLEVTSIY